MATTDCSISKVCSDCREPLPLEAFRCDRSRRDGHDHLCRECRTYYMLRWRYGISRERYEQLLVQQNGVCAICRAGETAKMYGKVTKLAVDHCHSSGEIRGLLCANCNIILGRAQDSIETLRAAIKYLEAPPTCILARDGQ